MQMNNVPVKKLDWILTN